MKSINNKDFYTKVKDFAYGFGNSFILMSFGIYAMPTAIRKLKEKCMKGFRNNKIEKFLGYLTGAGIGTLILKDQIDSYVYHFAYKDYSSLVFPILTNLISLGYESLLFISYRLSNRKDNFDSERKEISEINSLQLSKFDRETVKRNL